ncbi:hypothetical protein N7478_004711 [Penicillium angulare]|uniref:uncharacterized protein n=1 Tax=Penicillium angulare TaxID=116970 RepID=UPI0025417D85|nr:uncharacterized protein N7478_004711 [Penicillium angulare]KAJ5279339.1 hypothetical protein N7478_004711 [Penicillium angulare]
MNRLRTSTIPRSEVRRAHAMQQHPTFITHSSKTLPSKPINTISTKRYKMNQFSDVGPCHVHNGMREAKPYLEDNLPNQLCLLCTRAFCVDHKGKEDGVCEINHVTCYRNKMLYIERLEDTDS